MGGGFGCDSFAANRCRFWKAFDCCDFASASGFGSVTVVRRDFASGSAARRRSGSENGRAAVRGRPSAAHCGAVGCCRHVDTGFYASSPRCRNVSGCDLRCSAREAHCRRRRARLDSEIGGCAGSHCGSATVPVFGYRCGIGSETAVLRCETGCEIGVRGCEIGFEIGVRGCGDGSETGFGSDSDEGHEAVFEPRV